MLMQFTSFLSHPYKIKTIIRKNVNSLRERGDTDIFIKSARKHRTDPGAWQIWPCWVTPPSPSSPRSGWGMQSAGRPLPPPETRRHSSTCLKGYLSQTKRKEFQHYPWKSFLSMIVIFVPTIIASHCLWTLKSDGDIIRSLTSPSSDVVVNSSNADFTSCGETPDA